MDMLETSVGSAGLPMKQYATPDHQLICELAQHLAPYKIAPKFSLKTKDVKEICKTYGVRVIGVGKRGMQATERDLAVELFNQGLTREEVAEKLNIGKFSAGRYLWEMKAKAGMVSEKTAASVRKSAMVDKLRSEGVAAELACAKVGISAYTYNIYKGKK